MRSLYIGCHVTVMPEQSATRETVEHGILVKWDGAEDSEVSVLLDSQATDLRLLKCSVLRLLPMEEAPLPLASFTLSPDVMSSFEIFLPKRKSGDETTTQPTALQANFLFRHLDPILRQQGAVFRQIPLLLDLLLDLAVSCRGCEFLAG